MRKLAIVLVWVIAACGSTRPTVQPGALRVGMVYDNQPLAGAAVTVGGVTHTLDTTGNARFELAAGDYEGTIAATGIPPIKFRATVVAGKETVRNMAARSSEN